MVSILLLAHNKLELTRECIKSVYGFTDSSSFELVIVDNASTDATPEYLSEVTRQHRNIKVTRNDQNVSFAQGCNQGARMASGDYLLFLNNDTRVTQGWLDEMLSVFQNEERVGIVGSRLVYPDGGLQHGGVVLTLWRGLPINIDVNLEKEIPDSLEAREVFAVTGACMLINRDLFFDCGGFDEEYVYGYEDIDLCMKAAQKNYKIFYAPKSLVYHYASATFSEVKSLEVQLKNEDLFRSKWGKILEPAMKNYTDQLKEKGVLKVLIYGTGRAGGMLKAVLAENGFEILGFMDSNEEKWGRSFLNMRISSFGEAKSLEYDAILIASQFFNDIKETLKKNGLTKNIIAPIIS